MLKKEIICREVLEDKAFFQKQKRLSELCHASLSTVNSALAPLEAMGAIRKKPMGFTVVDRKKILLHWANWRSLKKDITYSTHSSQSAVEVEKAMPSAAVFTAYSAYRLRYNEAPADYGEVFVYADAAEVEKRFPQSEGRPNIFVLSPDERLKSLSRKGIAPDSQVFVDLWNIETWYANEFLKPLEARILG